MRRAERYARPESRLVRIVAISAPHDYPASLPPIEPFAVRAVGPVIRLREMALGA